MHNKASSYLSILGDANETTASDGSDQNSLWVNESSHDQGMMSSNKQTNKMTDIKKRNGSGAFIT